MRRLLMLLLPLAACVAEVPFPPHATDTPTPPAVLIDGRRGPDATSEPARTPPASTPGPLADREAFCFRSSAPDPLPALLRFAEGLDPDRLESALALESSRSPCLRMARSRGRRGDDLLIVSLSPRGTLLWIEADRWRGTSVDLDQNPLFLARTDGPFGEETLVKNEGGGSGGVASAIGFRKEAVAWRIFLQTPAYSQMQGELLDRDHLYVTGRLLPARPFAWDSNCCLPTSHQWLWRRAGTTFVLSGEREPIDPYYALSAYFGAVIASRPESLEDVASAGAAAHAKALFGRVGRIDVSYEWGAPSQPMFDATTDEMRSWVALPAAARRPVPAGPIVVNVAVGGSVGRWFEAVLRRSSAGWYVDELRDPS